MNQAHIHLILNHFPIVGSLIGTILLISGLLIKSGSVQKASLLVLLVMSLTAIPVFLTGEPAEEAVENIQGVNEAAIEEHEESAELALWVMMVAGASSLIAYILAIKKRYSADMLIKTTAILSIAASIMMMRTGYLGGQIRHTELYGNAVANGDAAGEANTEAPSGSDE